MAGLSALGLGDALGEVEAEGVLGRQALDSLEAPGGGEHLALARLRDVARLAGVDLDGEHVSLDAGLDVFHVLVFLLFGDVRRLTLFVAVGCEWVGRLPTCDGPRPQAGARGIC